MLNTDPVTGENPVQVQKIPRENPAHPNKVPGDIPVNPEGENSEKRQEIVNPSLQTESCEPQGTESI